MATRTQRLGVEGIVIDGQLRDIGHIRGLNLPVPTRLPLMCMLKIPRLLREEFQSLERVRNVELGKRVT